MNLYISFVLTLISISLFIWLMILFYSSKKNLKDFNLNYLNIYNLSKVEHNKLKKEKNLMIFYERFIFFNENNKVIYSFNYDNKKLNEEMILDFDFFKNLIRKLLFCKYSIILVVSYCFINFINIFVSIFFKKLQ